HLTLTTALFGNATRTNEERTRRTTGRKTPTHARTLVVRLLAPALQEGAPCVVFLLYCSTSGRSRSGRGRPKLIGWRRRARITMCVHPSIPLPIPPVTLIIPSDPRVACGGRLLRRPKARGALRAYTGTAKSGSSPSPSTHALTYLPLSSPVSRPTRRLGLGVSPLRATSFARGGAAADLCRKAAIFPWEPCASRLTTPRLRSRGTSGLQRAGADCAASPAFRFGLARVRLCIQRMCDMCDCMRDQHGRAAAHGFVPARMPRTPKKA
ncbi:hypothetical protein B0H16DRAFT_329413, partial [Mycena metata]